MAAASSAAGQRAQGGDGRMVEGAPDHGRHLCHLLDGVQAVEFGHQRVVERGGDRQRAQWAGQAIAVGRLAQRNSSA